MRIGSNYGQYASWSWDRDFEGNNREKRTRNGSNYDPIWGYNSDSDNNLLDEDPMSGRIPGMKGLQYCQIGTSNKNGIMVAPAGADEDCLNNKDNDYGFCKNKNQYSENNNYGFDENGFNNYEHRGQYNSNPFGSSRSCQLLEEYAPLIKHLQHEYPNSRIRITRTTTKYGDNNNINFGSLTGGLRDSINPFASAGFQNTHIQAPNFNFNQNVLRAEDSQNRYKFTNTHLQMV